MSTLERNLDGRIAQQKNPKGTFNYGDMRNFKLEKSVDSILITKKIKTTTINFTKRSLKKSMAKEAD